MLSSHKYWEWSDAKWETNWIHVPMYMYCICKVLVWVLSGIEVETIKVSRISFYGPAALGSASLSAIDPIHQDNQRWEVDHMMKENLAGDISKYSPWGGRGGKYDMKYWRGEESKCFASHRTIVCSNLSFLALKFSISFRDNSYSLLHFLSQQSCRKCIKNV